MGRTGLALSCAMAAAATTHVGRPPGAAAAEPKKLDVLFVIDDSTALDKLQEAVVTSFDRFLAPIATSASGMPDLHVGVVSANVGAGGYDIDGCEGLGDDGVLQNTPHGMCTPPNGRYIEDIAAPDGTRVRNYTGEIGDAFTCIARLGIGGCGFEQHLESMKRALDGHRAENEGFLREGSYLVVIIFGDEDDCSAADGRVFDPGQAALDGPYGPLTSYRCFEFGVQCAEGTPTRQAATYTDCVPREGSFIADPRGYEAFLRQLRPDPDKLIIFLVTSPAGPVKVRVDGDGTPSLDYACFQPDFEVVNPAPRLHWFANRFVNRSGWASLCEDIPGGMERAGRLVASVLDGTAPPAALPPSDLPPDCTCRAGGLPRAPARPTWVALLALAALAALPSSRRRAAAARAPANRSSAPTPAAPPGGARPPRTPRPPSARSP
jgi:hypothetical protein